MIAGPLFWSRTSIAIHDPIRACPCSRTRAVIVGGSAASAVGAVARSGATTRIHAAPRMAAIRTTSGGVRWGTGTPGADDGSGPSIDAPAPPKVAHATRQESRAVDGM